MVRLPPFLLVLLALAFPAISPAAPAARVAPKAPAPTARPTSRAPERAAPVAVTALAPVARIDGAEPTIRAIRGRLVSITVPAGFSSVNLQALTSPPKGRSAPGVPPPGPEWKTVAAKLVKTDGEIVSFQVPRLIARPYLRVLGTKAPPAAESFLGDFTTFPADLEASHDGSAGLSFVSGTAGNVSLSSTSYAGASSGTSTARAVSESDLWKIDGDRLYFYNSVRGLQVFDIANPDQPRVLGTLAMPGAGEQMYQLDKDHMVLLRNENFWWSWLDWNFPLPRLTLNTAASITLATGSTTAIQSAYGYVRYNNNAVHSVVVVDVSSGTPLSLAEVPFEGSLMESRLVGKVLYLATYGFDRSVGQWGGWGYRLLSYDLADPAHPVQRASNFTGVGITTVSATDQYFFVVEGASYPTVVQIFDISDPHGAIVQAGKVTVDGLVMDKFKINQRGTTLTVVCGGWRNNAAGVWNPYSLVSTFSIADPLKPVALATLDGPANEQLYATRFDGARLYMVTSVRNWDPLLVIDLSNPAQPTVLGSVEMPGFSTFIQPLGDRLVATGLVGRQPTVDLYDVKDASAPKLLSRVSIAPDDAYAYTEATWNEKAFNVLPESNLILLPISSYSGDGTTRGVQLIDLLPDRLVKRGVLERKLVPRRAGLHGTRMICISSKELLTVKTDDRDHPVVTSEVEIAWPVSRTLLAGPWLLELGGDPWGSYAPTLTVTPAGNPDSTTADFALPNLNIVGATMRNGVLCVLQADPRYRTEQGNPFIPDGTALTLSTFDLSQLPKVSLLGRVTVDRASSDYLLYADLKPLWVNDRTLLFTRTANRSLFPYYPVNTVATTESTSSTSNITLMPAVTFNLFLGWGWGYWSSSTELLAFDLTSPGQPKFASRLKLGGDDTWNVSAPFTASDKVYLSFKVLPSNKSKEPVPGALHHFLNVIDYSNSTAPVAVPEAPSLPGELRGLGELGALLYTVGPLLDPEARAKDTSRAVHASRFDGSAVHLLDQIPLESSAQPILVSGNALLVLSPQPALLPQWDPVTYLYPPNPQRSVLQTWSLDGNDKFSRGSTLKLDHELSIGQIRNLGVLRDNTATVRLLDLNDPLHPADLGVHPIHGNGSSSLDRADGDVTRGLWLPLGENGVDMISLAP